MEFNAIGRATCHRLGCVATQTIPRSRRQFTQIYFKLITVQIGDSSETDCKQVWNAKTSCDTLQRRLKRYKYC